MQIIIDTILRSGESAINLALFILLPIMVVMMAFMRLLEDRGVLRRIALFLAPATILIGLPGVAVFAILQILFVSFAAPVATLKIMEQDPAIDQRSLAATFAAVITMSQANATFPLAAVGLNLPVAIGTSLAGGMLAAWIAWRWSPKPEIPIATTYPIDIPVSARKNVFQTLFAGGEEGLQLVLKAIPMLVLAVLTVNILKNTGAIGLLQTLVSPIFQIFGVPGIAVLPIVTKFLAGGTAMMAVTLDLVEEGLLSALDVNRIAGFTIHPCDPVGIAVLVSAGLRIGLVAKIALKAAAIAIVGRGIAHLLIF
ncbi:nucleoside recognition domain-containing protein [Chrysiogenes arsenatis]|uniref:nucleoside recognition domain-containing protein n=1 Tax=Chrysiogenes arsenatis TaxID=309797 RepID=UPI000411E53A|nr:nucleoside recognition domain-containing protein [Chrysiogenes arsenatis]